MKEKELKEKIYELLDEKLDGMLYCDRVWSAWSYGTMSENDFYNLAEDEEYIEEFAEEILQLIKMKEEKNEI